jgi:hypothetical protein
LRQHRFDSFLETVVNTAVGFVVAMLTYRYIISPLFGFGSNATQSAGVVAIFMVASMLRQYVIRRLFDGKSIYVGLRDLYERRKLENERRQARRRKRAAGRRNSL